MRWKTLKVVLWKNRVLVLGSGIALLLGYLGYWEHNQAGALSWGAFWNNLYQALQLFVLEANFSQDRPINTTLQLARFVAPFVTAAAVAEFLFLAFAGRPLRFKKHVVICGLGKIGTLLAESYKGAGLKVVVIEKSMNNSSIDKFKERGIPVLLGDATDWRMLERARVQDAQFLLCACGTDSTNIEISLTALKNVQGRDNQPLECLAHVADRRLCNLLTLQETETRRPDSVRLSFFNLYDLGARALVQHSFVPLHRSAKDLNEDRPRLLVIGDGALSQSFLVQAALAWDPAVWPEKFHLTLIDRDANDRVEILKGRYPELAERCDLQGHSVPLDSAKFEEAAYLLADKDKELDFTDVFILTDGDSEAMSAALTLQEKLANQDIRIILAMTYQSGLIENVWQRRSATGSPIKLRVFNLMRRVLHPGILFRTGIEEMARAFHEDYVAKAKDRGETPATNPLLVEWKSLSEEMKESNRQVAEHVGVKLGAIDCYLVPRTDWKEPLFQFDETKGEVTHLAQLEHERYREEREGKGWTYGPGQKNEELKTNPTLVPWEKLSDVEKEKDRDIVRNMPALLAKAGFAIRRR